MMDDKIKRVRELDAAATPGPWFVSDSGSVTNWPPVVPCPDVMMEYEETSQDAQQWPRIQHEVQLIAEYRTLAPALADELEAARKEIEKLRADLKAAWFEADVEKECHESTDAIAAKNIAEVRQLETQFLDARSALAAERARAEKAEAELAKERGRAARLEESMRTLAEQISTNTHPDEVQISSPARHLMGQRILLELDQWWRDHGAAVRKAEN